MKLLAVGGGSGGHVTPVLAVVNQLHALDSELQVRFVCDRAFESQSRGLMKHAKAPVSVSTIHAGKYRRYHGENLVSRLTDFRTIWLNIRDTLFIAAGFLQSLVLLITDRPDVVFAKGGYVCLPLGLAAKILRIPLVIHDSDTRPGLTNKVLGKFADTIGTGSPLQNYNYDPNKTVYVGVPIQSEFHPFSKEEVAAAKSMMGVIDLNAPLVVVTGGGLGAKSINEAMIKDGHEIIRHGIHVYHVSGKRHFEDVSSRVFQHPHYQVVPFVYKDMHKVLGAADLVVSRASATFLQELAGLAKPTIVVPAEHLGDQIKNAVVYQKSEAAIVLSDREILQERMLGSTIINLLKYPEQMQKLSHNLQQFAKPDAALNVARMIVGAHNSRTGQR